MEKELKYISCNRLYSDYLKEITQIIHSEFNQRELKIGGALSLSVDCFSLGLIVAKKSERARHKINNDKILKRQEKLLLEIEALKIKNDKLEKVLDNIKEELLEVEPSCKPIPKKSINTDAAVDVLVSEKKLNFKLNKLKMIQ